jgi:hypothetical protein
MIERSKVLGRQAGIKHLTFVVSPKAGRVEDNGITRFVDDSGVAIPQVPMDERRFDFSTIALQRPQQPRNDLVKQSGQQGIQFGTWSRSFLASLQDMTQAIGKESFPAVVPGVVLWQVTVVGCAMEAELALGRRVG